MIKNVWEIRNDKNLRYILPDRHMYAGEIDHAEAAVVAYIYYEDTVGRYLEYIDNVPSDMDVYLISSNEITIKALNRFSDRKDNVKVIKKTNRGRDISALVISSREFFERYAYICFVHDKKEKCESDKKIIDFWIENLWGNTLKSEGYINNVLHIFADNAGIGLLTPPEPYLGMRNADLWYDEYERTLALAHEIGLMDTSIEKKYPPITLGTVFWCRTCVMKKLFGKKWELEDFVSEPMPGEGTVSHAVERILAYLAQDAGYDTGTVMSDEYALKLMRLQQKECGEARDIFGNIGRLCEFYARKGQIQAYAGNHRQLYLYGAGRIGKFYLILLEKLLGITPEAFLVTDGMAWQESVNGISVMRFEEIAISKDTGIIISVGKNIAGEIKGCLESKNYLDYLYIPDLPVDGGAREDMW